MTERTAAARKSAVVLGECLRAWRRGDEGEDTQAGSIVVAEFINLVRQFLKKT